MDSKLAEMDQLDEINANLKQNLTSSKFMIQKLNEERESAESELRFKLWVDKASKLMLAYCMDLNGAPSCDHNFETRIRNNLGMKWKSTSNKLAIWYLKMNDWKISIRGKDSYKLVVCIARAACSSCGNFNVWWA